MIFLQKGFNYQETIERMQQLEYRIIKAWTKQLSRARKRQKKKIQHERSCLSPKRKQLKELQFKKRFYNQMEILNRQSLPLQQGF